MKNKEFRQQKGHRGSGSRSQRPDRQNGEWHARAPHAPPSQNSRDSHALPRPITYTKLKHWVAATDAGQLVLSMTTERQQLEELLHQQFIPPDWFYYLVLSVGQAVTAKHQRQSVMQLLETLCASSFFDAHLRYYLSFAPPEFLAGVLKSLSTIIQSILDILPSKSEFCFRAAVNLGNIVQSYGNVINLTDIVEDLTKIFNRIQQNQNQITTEQNTAVSFSNEEKPPENFRKMSVYPIMQDLESSARTFFRSAVKEGAYSSVEHYLDVQFRLMREDFIIPIRQGLAELRNNPGRQKTSNLSLRIYHGVRLIQKVFSSELRYQLAMNMEQLKKINWNTTKRLIKGALVCLSKDNFKTIIVATVHSQKLLKKGRISVVISSGYDALYRNNSDDLYIMAEAVNLFEPYLHVLKGIQEMSSEIPFKRYVIKCKKVLKPPCYLSANKSLKFSLSCLMDRFQAWQCPVLELTKWPSAERMCLNSSQREAAMLALTNEMVLIQGPPGTGKTYVGLKVMEAIMRNASAAFGQGQETPILVVCYTNHALDQFLEGILKFCENGIVRVGGGSKCEQLKKFNLYELKRNRENNKKFDFVSVRKSREECVNNMKKIIADINRLEKEIKYLKWNIKSETVLRDFISDAHYKSLCNDSPDAGDTNSKIAQWLNADTERDQDLLEKKVDEFLYKLVLNWDYSIHLDDVTDPLCLDITARASLYHTAVVDFRRELKISLAGLNMKIKSLKDDSEQEERTQVLKQKEHLKKRLVLSTMIILQDAEIERFLPDFLFEKIKRHMKPLNLDIASGEIIKTWILGVNTEVTDKLRDIQTLISDMGIKLVGVLNKETSSKTKSKYIEDEYNNIDGNLEDSDSSDGEEETDEMSIKDYMNYNKMLEDVDKLFHVVRDSKESNWAKNDQKKTNPRFTSEGLILEPMPRERAESVTNIWELSGYEKYALYNNWVQGYRKDLDVKLKKLVEKYNAEFKRKEEIEKERTLFVLKSAKIIGMTTTGAAKHRGVLQQVGSKIIVVEEAAEVFESHIITALNAHCNHLILIGDHQQLRPKPNVYELARDHGLEISLFERLVKNNVPHAVLKMQHRMRPEISKLMRHIYPSLEDDDSVKEYENIKGVGKNIFLINHHHEESNVHDSLSKKNVFEAEYVVALCKYLLTQDYSPQNVTILTTYVGQVLAIRSLARKSGLSYNVRIAAVDDFQGEENDIIVLSLVRSNKIDSVGFLKVENRICVALSRAKKGLYVIGNFDLLASQSTLWSAIVKDAKEDDIIGEGLPIRCVDHPDHVLAIKTAAEFRKCGTGWCGEKCEQLLPCGHVCGRPCHGSDPNHVNSRCRKPCGKVCGEGHPCRKKCYQDCGGCDTLVQKTLKCGHAAKIECGEDPDYHACQSQCSNILECSHRCTGTCNRCSTFGNHEICTVQVSYTWPCGDVKEIPCNLTKQNPPCTRICEVMLDCRHKCTGTCSACSTDGHKVCQDVCVETLPCGHRCKGRCVDCADNKQHKPCREDCGKMLKCGHKCRGKCSECEHDCHPPCAQRCQAELSCSHKCKGICWECSETGHEKCIEKCSSLLPCNHKCQGRCSNCTEKGHASCRSPCSKTLVCNHKCRGTCGDCMENGHAKCLEKCDLLLTCSHKCKGSCGTCLDTGHVKCLNTCGSKLPCQHDCKGVCGDCLDNGHKKCTSPCTFKLACKHPCTGVCRECQDKGHAQCISVCGASLPCTHRCTGKCLDCPVKGHVKCLKNCIVYLPCKHKCMGKCGECSLSGHAECRRNCEAELPCEHQCKGVCGECVLNGHTKCLEPCGEILPCKHTCKGECGTCASGVHSPCVEKCPVKLPCQHTCSGDCCDCTTGQHSYCVKKCKKPLPCGHNCQGTCGVCTQTGQHAECQQDCGNTLVCGHKCTGVCGKPCVPCTMECPSGCRHRTCNSINPHHRCGQPCPPCEETDLIECPHNKMSKLCHEQWTVKPCEQKCTEILKIVSVKKGQKSFCRHPCAGICGETCVCVVCETVQPVNPKLLASKIPFYQRNQNQDRLIIKIPSCSHIFYVDELDHFVFNFDPNGTKFIRCPKCNKPITKCHRYDNIVRDHFIKRERLKAEGKICLPKSVTQSQKMGVSQSMRGEQNKIGGAANGAANESVGASTTGSASGSTTGSAIGSASGSAIGSASGSANRSVSSSATRTTATKDQSTKMYNTPASYRVPYGSQDQSNETYYNPAGYRMPYVTYPTRPFHNPHVGPAPHARNSTAPAESGQHPQQTLDKKKPKPHEKRRKRLKEYNKMSHNKDETCASNLSQTQDTSSSPSASPEGGRLGEERSERANNSQHGATKTEQDTKTVKKSSKNKKKRY
ncbi:NFX1-type zinc finger-containing protein 1-like [Physella acuta]|uniref:NFX1-type zinc finger-containing protein 1-like n=1 Tax=Physella acuta TaxID=109671 RepID=UPI0027DD2BA9|nr:NFX1-type zinc finger-containing protein 1-like [Physella acuta]